MQAELLLYSLIGLFIMFIIIMTAVRDVVMKRVEPYLRVQAACTKAMAAKQGISTEDIDRNLLTDKQFKKKYNIEKKID
jgi:hypothetical protein